MPIMLSYKPLRCPSGKIQRSSIDQIDNRTRRTEVIPVKEMRTSLRHEPENKGIDLKDTYKVQQTQ